MDRATFRAERAKVVNEYFASNEQWKLDILSLSKKMAVEHPDLFENHIYATNCIKYHKGEMPSGSGYRKTDTTPRRRKAKKEDIIVPDGQQVKTIENVQEGTVEMTFGVQTEIRTLDELIERCKIDTTKWTIIRYVQNYWGNKNNPNWQVKVWCSTKTHENEFKDAFIEFLNSYKPVSPVISPLPFTGSPKASLILNKQDAHMNKYDVDGNNDIQERFRIEYSKVAVILKQARLANDVENIFYILGSDIFNSEFTNTTTKGTPQQNMDSYHSSFLKICDHEINTISILLEYAPTVNIIFVPGNHDEYVGWHLIHWLKAYFRNHADRIIFDIDPDYRKYVSYGKTALMFNHGDAIKPPKLAGLFPMEFKANWSDHLHFYIFTGDKHHEVSHDFNGIKFYQIPSFSDAKSLWDKKNGYTCSRGEVTGFLIDKIDGMTNIYKQYL